jgi:hypothetical protein
LNKKGKNDNRERVHKKLDAKSLENLSCVQNIKKFSIHIYMAAAAAQQLGLYFYQ